MSLMGQKQTLQNVRPMSALPPKADITEQFARSGLCQKQTFRCLPYLDTRTRPRTALANDS